MAHGQETLSEFANRAFGQRTIRHAIQTSNVARARSPKGRVRIAARANQARLAALRAGTRPGSFSGPGMSGRRPGTGRGGGGGAGRTARGNQAAGDSFLFGAGGGLDPPHGRSNTPAPIRQSATPRPAPAPRATPTTSSGRPRQQQRATTRTPKARKPAKPRNLRNLLGLRS